MLLHICCANCAVYPVKRLREENKEVTGLWYNPNIHPYTEYQARFMSAGFFAQKIQLPLIQEGGYGLGKWMEKIGSSWKIKKQRCNLCYRLRLKKTAEAAKVRGFDSFTTTLLYSKFQDQAAIKEIGEEVSRETGIKFYYEDFRPGWKEGIEASKVIGLYHQQYCGCIFSEMERYCSAQVTRAQEHKSQVASKKKE